MDRFASITDEDIAFLVLEKDSDNTKKATCVSVALFQHICRKKAMLGYHLFTTRRVSPVFEEIVCRKRGKRMGVNLASQHLLQLGSVYAVS